MTSQLFPMILFGIATAFSPGPNNIMTSYTAFNFGVKKAIPTMLGVIIGWTLLIILLQLGSVSIFQKYQFIQTIIKVLGSIYLLYIAYKLSFGGQSKDKKLDPKPVTFINTFFFQFVNPKILSTLIWVCLTRSFLPKLSLSRLSLAGLSFNPDFSSHPDRNSRELSKTGYAGHVQLSIAPSSLAKPTLG